MYTAGTSRMSMGATQGAPVNANAVSPMARYAYKNELGEQVRDALATRVFVLSDAIAVMNLNRSLASGY